MSATGERTEWDDWLESHLFDRRVVVLRGSLDHDAATRAASKLMTLDAIGDDKIELQLDSPGGPLEAAFAVVDVLDALGVEVEVTCLGRVEGAAVLVAAVCGRRLAMEHTRFRLSDPDVVIEGKARELDHLVENHRSALAHFYARLAEACRRSPAEVDDACSGRRWMDAGEAVRWGIVDEVARRRQAVVRRFSPRTDEGTLRAPELIGLRPPPSPPRPAR